MNYTEEELLAFIDRHDQHEEYYRRKLAELQAENTPELFNLGDRVDFTGTVRKVHAYRYGYRTIDYQDAPPPYFEGFKLEKGRGWQLTKHPRTSGVIVGKRTYRSMENDEGVWVPDGKQVFTGYLVAYHLSRNPVIVRADQMTRQVSATN